VGVVESFSTAANVIAERQTHRMEESVAEIDTNAVRQRLEDEKARLERDIYERTQGDEVTQTVDPITEISGPGVEDADDADALSDNERNQGIVDAERETLAQVNAALQRLDEGKYGICARCGKPIPPRRLEAIPYATLCVEDQALAEHQAGGGATL
jgi:DnaK suppressor protein